MNNLNSILIEGSLAQDPVFRTTAKGIPLCTFDIEVKRSTGRDVETSFFNVESWSAIAECCRDQGSKGRGVRVVGRLKQDRWTGQDGKPRSRVSIVAEHVEFRPDFKSQQKESEQPLLEERDCEDG